jgi:hypothetical protein
VGVGWVSVVVVECSVGYGAMQLLVWCGVWCSAVQLCRVYT